MIYADESPDRARVSRFQYTPEVPNEFAEGSVWAAAFRQENDVVNALALLRRNQFEPEPGFDYAARAKESELFINYADSFVGIESNAEWDSVEQRLRQEQKDRAVLNAAGLPGIGAAMVAGVLSPTVLLPAGLGMRAQTVGQAALSSAGWALVGVGAQEAILQTNQDLRTAGESAISIGTGMAAASILGGAIRWAGGDELAEIYSRMDAGPDQPYIQRGLESTGGRIDRTWIESEVAELERALGIDPDVARESLSAAVNPDPEVYDPAAFLDAGKPEMRAAGFGWLGPVTRQAMANSPVKRSVMSQLSTAGVARTENKNFMPTAEGGDIETRKMFWQAKLAQGIAGERKFYYDWMARTGQGGKFRGWINRSAMKRFNTEVGRAMEMRLYNRMHPVPEVAQAAQRYIDQAFLPLIRQAKESGMPQYANLSEMEILRIAHQKVSPEAIWRESDTVRSIVQQNILRQLQSNPKLLRDPKVRAWLELDQDAGGTTTRSRILQMQEFAEAAAQKILSKWEGSYNKHGTLDTMNEIPIRKEFVYIDPNAEFRVNGQMRTFGEFLERDVEKIARSFTRSMAGPVELYRVFGTTTPELRESQFKAQFWTEMQREDQRRIADIWADDKLTRAQKEKAEAKVHAELRAFERDFEVVVSRIKNNRGQPDDPRAMGFRLARAAMNLNVVRLMGTVTISSIPDLGRLVMKHGFMNVWRDLLVPLFTDIRALKIGMDEVAYSGASLDLILHGRANAIFDAFEDAEFGNAFERGLQTATNMIGTVALFDYWNQTLKGMAGNLIIADMSRALHKVGTGQAGGREARFLAALGIDEPTAKRIWKKMSTDGGEEVRKGVWMPNTEDWGKIDGEDIYDFDKMDYKEKFTPEQIKKAKADEELARIYRAALARGIVDTIITPGVERPNWVDSSSAARLIAQFRSFGLSSTLKSGVAAVQDARMGNFGPVLSGMSISLALGAVSYYLWAMGFGPDSPQAKRAQREFDDAIAGDTDAMARIADEAIARSGLLGVLEEVRRVGERVPLTQDAVTLADTPTTRSPFNSPVTEALGPTVGLLSEFDKILSTLDEPRESTFDAMRRLTPYQNVFYLRWAMDNMLYGNLKELAGVQ